MGKRFVIIDAQALIHRAYHALPETLTNKEGEVTNALYGFTSVFLRMLSDLEPRYIAAAFDRAEPTFRHKQYEEYKSHRPETPQALIDQVPKVKEMLRAFGVPVLEKAGYEADDIIGTLVQEIDGTDNIQILIVTGDLDTLQLVNEHTQVYTLKTGISDTVTYGLEEVRERYGLEPGQLPDYKGLVGDSSDNIPGVNGVGKKTASKLLSEYGDIDGVYKALENEKITGRAASALQDSHEEALFSKELATIRLDVEMDFELEQAAWSVEDYDRKAVEKVFEKQGFRSLLSRLPGKEQGGEAKKQHKVSSQELAKESEIKKVAEELNPEAEVVVVPGEEHIAFGQKPEKLYVFNNKANLVSGFLRVLISQKYTVSGWDLKELLKNTEDSQLEIWNDYKILAWLLRPDTPEPSLERFGSGDLKFSDEEAPAAVQRLAQLLAAKDQINQQIDSFKLTNFYKKVERPLIPVLAAMEQTGINLDGEQLKKEAKEIAKKLEELQKRANDLAGSEINMNSPKQLRALLFDKLEISTKGVAKTPGGDLSTDERELQKLRDEHEIIPIILEYRELAKLKNTYFDALPGYIAEDGRVHTTFLQTGTATGRLSSRNPNLQNIPAHGEYAKKLRSAFTAQDGYELATFDFSQAELRLAAHLSQDEFLIDAFKRGRDIHTATAEQVFNIESDQVDSEMRRKAKIANFGVFYGLSIRGFSEQLGVDREEAKKFINSYFERFTGLSEWIESVKKEARSKGYAQTIFGRKRPLPNIRVGDYRTRAAAEREAVNFPIQGGVADMMKLAMIEISNRVIARSSLKASDEAISYENIRLLLQIHDELIFEIKQEKLDECQEQIANIMESIVELSVPLEVESATGTTWADLK